MLQESRCLYDRHALLWLMGDPLAGCLCDRHALLWLIGDPLAEFYLVFLLNLIKERGVKVLPLLCPLSRI